MQGNQDGAWFRHPAITTSTGEGSSGTGTGAGAGLGPGGFYNPAVHPLASNFNIQSPNLYHLLQNQAHIPFINPCYTNSFIGTPNFPIHQQNLQFPPHQIPSFSAQNPNLSAQNPSFVPRGLGDNSGFSQVNGKSSSHPPQQFGMSGRKNDIAHSEIKSERIEFSDKTFSKTKQKVVPNKSVDKGKLEESLERIDGTAREVRKAMVMAGESVSSFKVSQTVLSKLGADSWRSLGVQMQDVATLRKLMTLEGKINAFIHCFVGVRKIATLYDLEVAICEIEGVNQFDDLDMGPLLRHPLVLLYFPSSTGVTKAFKITSEEIIFFLEDFIDTSRKMDVKIDEFLNFIAKKKLVTGKEKLGVRIQNLGMYVSFILDAKRQEGQSLKNFFENLQKKYGHFSSSKEQQDDATHTVSQRLESFPFVHKDFRGKHIRFGTLSSDNEDYDGFNFENENNDSDAVALDRSSSKNVKSSDNVSSCPYPSATEEMKRLGSSNKKRKSKNLSPSSSEPSKLRKRKRMRQETLKPVKDGGVSRDDDADTSSSDDSLKLFISTWNDACKKLPAQEVLERMVEFYKSEGHDVPGRRSMRLLSSHPFVGLLNVAITSMKRGLWDNIYQVISQEKPACCGSEIEAADIRPIDTLEPVNNHHDSLPRPCVTDDEIIRRVGLYFEHEVSGENLTSFRKLRDCEVWLAQQFHVQDFKSLGCGEFFLFLENQISLLPVEVQKLLVNDPHKQFAVEVQALEDFLTVLLSQALNFSVENESITKEMVSLLLTRQFPSVSFKVVVNESMDTFTETITNLKKNATHKCALFSVTLLGTENYLAHEKKCSEESVAAKHDTGEGTGVLKSITSKRALDGILRAPVLSELNSWCHWDLIFAPSLGPLVEWLLNDVNSKELLCLVTKDSKVLRVDPSATADSFLEAALQGSAFQTAGQLLSLITLNGVKHVPLSLLKAYTQRAFEVLLNNHLEMLELTDGQKRKTQKAEDIAARFLLDCLYCLPAEFRPFAAGILLSGLKLVIKNAPEIVLSMCQQIEHRVMLHEAGLSLGIMEWINDYHLFCSTSSTCAMLEGSVSNSSVFKDHVQKLSGKLSCTEGSMILSKDVCEHKEKSDEFADRIGSAEGLGDSSGKDVIQETVDIDAASIIHSIRQDEFGLDLDLSGAESSMLLKQHARLGRALQCLSQELYSQDSHFILELVQNADDNTYPVSVEPTITFVLQETGIVVLNNECGFSVENIRALCDVGQSTKKSSSGYIGKKGIGFKSVFRVSDSPEIHSNGFHIKFDISEGQIGFILPTIVPRFNIDSVSGMLSGQTLQLKDTTWNTCILLPFRNRVSEEIPINTIEAMFSDLHPSLLLFLNRLQSIVYRNMIEDSFVVMRKETVEENIIKVSCGENHMSWFVASQKLQAEKIRRDVQLTEISAAFTLDELGDGNYRPHVSQQPVFAFLPLRTYGLKFILHGDFVLTSSREEVDEDSAWNQWLLSEIPNLFISAQRLFCSLPCFRENPGKSVGAYMQYVPLVGEVHGFFSSLPRNIISKLRMSNCLLLEGDNEQWVPPCKVLRGWTEHAKALLPESLLREHLGLGFLDKDIVLDDSLSRALGIEDYGPKILVQILSSLSCKKDGLQSMGTSWLSSFLIELYMLSFDSSGHLSFRLGEVRDLLKSLRDIPFIPLSAGHFSSLDEGGIWLHYNNVGSESGREFEAFPKLYASLRTVDYSLLSASAADKSCTEVNAADNLVKMLCTVGVQRLSAHEIVKVHILPVVSDEGSRNTDKTLMMDYLCFVMIHLQSGCQDCHRDRGHIISELKSKVLVSTNYGMKRPSEVSIHFGEDFGNCFTPKKLIKDLDIVWHEIDMAYLNHPTSESLACGSKKWREFFQEIGITDFVQVVQVEKSPEDIWRSLSKDMKGEIDLFSPTQSVKDWESPELEHLLSCLSKSGDRESCKYLLEILDMLWDESFCDKTAIECKLFSGDDVRYFKSSFMQRIRDTRWVPSSMDDTLHYSTDLFYDCDEVHSVLGNAAPYAVPKLRSMKLLNDIGFKTKVTLDDALGTLEAWGLSRIPFKASISQMARFYSFLWNEMPDSKQKIKEKLLSAPSIFVPCETRTRHSDMVLGGFRSLHEVYWKVPSGVVDQISEISSQISIEPLSSKTLCNVYSSLHDFFVNECGVPETPSFNDYLEILRQLSQNVSPSCAAKAVFQVFLRWTDELKSGRFSEDICSLKESLAESEFAMLPTEQDKWVSLHCSFGLVCWGDDEELKKRFKRKDNINFIYFGKLSDEEKEIVRTKVSTLMDSLGIPRISEVVTREARYEDLQDSSLYETLVDWSLPYAQRYINSLHHDKYSQMNRSIFRQLKHLKVVVVKKLWYRNVITQHSIVSKKQFDCKCLLQGNVLYTTPEKDFHSLFMELSRLFFNGTPDLHLANFLHMITTMAESGLKEEHTDSFVLNTQNVQKLPDDERVWFVKSARKLKKKAGTNLSWPPASWKTKLGHVDDDDEDPDSQLATRKPRKDLKKEKVPIDAENLDLVAGDDHTGVVSQDRPKKSHPASKPSQLNSEAAINPFDQNMLSVDHESGFSDFSDRDKLQTGTPWAAQALQTGRMGEEIAFRYFTDKCSDSAVKWVNEYNETGLPYDIMIEEGDGKKQYIEVKATISATKDWFNISVREWQFAWEKGECFSVAHVLLGNNDAILTEHKNPVKLCQEGRLRLVILMPNQQNEFKLV